MKSLYTLIIISTVAMGQSAPVRSTEQTAFTPTSSSFEFYEANAPSVDPESSLFINAIADDLSQADACRSYMRKDGFVHSMILEVEYVQKCEGGKLGALERPIGFESENKPAIADRPICEVMGESTVSCHANPPAKSKPSVRAFSGISENKRALIHVRTCSIPHKYVDIYSDSNLTTHLPNPFSVNSDNAFTFFAAIDSIEISGPYPLPYCMYAGNPPKTYKCTSEAGAKLICEEGCRRCKEVAIPFPDGSALYREKGK